MFVFVCMKIMVYVYVEVSVMIEILASRRYDVEFFFVIVFGIKKLYVMVMKILIMVLLMVL